MTRVLVGEVVDENDRPRTVKFLKRAHEKLNYSGVSYGAFVVFPGNVGRVLAGSDAQELEEYIREHMTGYLAAEVFKMENLQ